MAFRVVTIHFPQLTFSLGLATGLVMRSEPESQKLVEISDCMYHSCQKRRAINGSISSMEDCRRTPILARSLHESTSPRECLKGVWPPPASHLVPTSGGEALDEGERLSNSF